MKKQKIYLMLATMLISCMVALGQTPNGKTNNGNSNIQHNAFIENHVDNLKQDITLTATQEQEIRNLLDKFYKNREKAAKKANKEQKRNDKKQSYEVYIDALYQILTEEQCEILDRKAEERKRN